MQPVAEHEFPIRVIGMLPAKTLAESATDWWRHAVIYQIYPRSFADSNGDGIGDLPGIISRLPEIARLGVDAIWLSPFYTSPQKDAGYDVADYCDIDPVFGTLADAERLISCAHDLGLRVIVDIVPNHSSSAHEWFQAALAATPGSVERERYMFRDGTGESGNLPPNNWESVFGGPAWTRVTEPSGQLGQWYLHIFDSSQPDLNWQNPEIWEMFRGVLRFWLDRGVDGFRVDVAHGLIKEDGLPDKLVVENSPVGDGGPFWDQDGVHEVYRDWRTVLDEYGPDRVLCAEAWVMPLKKMAWYVRPDEMHQAFNFGYLSTGWDAPALRGVIDESLAAFGSVGSPSTWVLSNHDVIRHRSRLATTSTHDGQPTGIGPLSEHKPDEELGFRRGRAATALMLGLPGSAYVYQGEELGLPEVIDIPDNKREDPTFFRTHGERYGRDGCRVPIPWESQSPAFGFNTTGASWLPQPAVFGTLARDAQQGDPASTLELYKNMLRHRAENSLGSGTLEWLPGYAPSIVAFVNNGVAVIANTGTDACDLPGGELLVASGPLVGGALPGDATAWVKLTS
jgi:alpha-glucosidase